jgi:hypothetical protein
MRINKKFITSSTNAAFVVNQVGIGEIADFQSRGVSVMSIAPDYYLTDANNNIGKIYVGTGSGLRGFVRGANGIYGLDLSHTPAEQSAEIGYRCAK